MNNINLHIIGSETFVSLLDELSLGYHISSNKILKYNKQDVFVRIVFVDKLLAPEIKNFFLENIPTIFLLNNKDYLIKHKLSPKEFHVVLHPPIEILSFREILNILISKHNFFKKSKIIINGYEIDSNQRVIMKKGTKVKLTEKELNLILILERNNGLEKSSLLKSIWNHNSDLESHAFETHLHRLRKKMNTVFKDTKFIIEKNSLYYLDK
jgi:hypothetical protein